MKLEEFLMHQTDIVSLPVGQTLFAEGDAGDSMYVLMSGKADVMIRGKVVETLPADRLATGAQHPYSQLLFASVPKLDTGWLDSLPSRVA